MKKRIFAVIFAACVISTLLIGCGQSATKEGTNDQPDSTTITEKTNQHTNQPSEKDDKKPVSAWCVKTFTDAGNKLIVDRGTEYSEKTGIPVSVELFTTEDLITKWPAAIASGQPPEVSYFGYEDVTRYANENVLRDMTSLYDKIDKATPFFDSVEASVLVDGKKMGVPFWFETQVLYYRKDLLKAAGYSEPPKTWEEFREMAKKTTDPKQNIYGAGIGFGNSNSDAEWLVRCFLWAHGSYEFDEDGSVIINSPETVKALQIMKDIFLKDKSTPPSATNWDDSGNNKAFLSGQSTFVFNTGSIANALINKGENPELLANLGLATIPEGPEGRFVPGILNCMSVFANSANPEGGEAFLEFLYEKEWYNSWIKSQAPLAVPVLEELKEDPIWAEEYNKPFIESVPGSTYLGHKGTTTSLAGEVYSARVLNHMFLKLLMEDASAESVAVEWQAELEKMAK